MLVFWYPPPAGSTKPFLESPGTGGLALACNVVKRSSMCAKDEKDRKHTAVLWGARFLTKWVKSIWEHIFPDNCMFSSQKTDILVEQTGQYEYWPSEFRK